MIFVFNFSSFPFVDTCMHNRARLWSWYREHEPWGLGLEIVSVWVSGWVSEARGKRKEKRCGCEKQAKSGQANIQPTRPLLHGFSSHTHEFLPFWKCLVCFLGFRYSPRLPLPKSSALSRFSQCWKGSREWYPQGAIIGMPYALSPPGIVLPQRI